MFKDIISLLPFFVCLFWTVVMSLEFRKNKIPLKLLTVFMGLSAILYFAHALFFYDYNSLYSKIDPLYVFASLSVYPLFFIYIKSLAKEPVPSVNNFYLFIPSVVVSLLVLAAHLFSPGLVDAADKLARVIFVVQVPLVVVYGSRLIRDYHKRINEYYSSTEGRELGWLNRMLLLLMLTGVLSITAGILGREYFRDLGILTIPSLAFSIMLFYIGYTGFMQKFSIVDFHIELAESKSDIKEEHKEGSLAIHEKTREKIKTDLIILFEEREFFRKTDLRISDVSAELGTNRSYISSVVNIIYNTTFTDFVNRYRVEYAKKLLLSEDNHILDYIAEESGFASVNSLLRAFRKETGTTPGQFRKKSVG